MEGISVIICCYNSEKFLPKTLEAIAAQEVNSQLNWEVIIVDNNSKDKTTEVAFSEWSKYSSKIDFRVVSEPTLGLSAARAKGFEEAKFEFCLFCDDDNWLDKDYLEKSFALLSQDSAIGVLGGRGIEVCETEPPEWFNELKGGYAVGNQADKTGDITISRGFVYGAGAIFRKSIYLELKRRGFRSLLTDRKGNSLSSGGDRELSYAFRLTGCKIVYSHESVFKHFIPNKKLTEDYVLKMYKGFASAQPILTLYEYVLNDLTNGVKKEKDISFLWIKDMVYTIYLSLNSFRQGSLKVKMQSIVLINLFKLIGSYKSKYRQIAALRK